MREKINVINNLNKIMKALKTGALVTTKSNGKVNTMTVSWGSIGIEWNKQICTIYIRKSRFTHEMLENNGEFTLNVCLDKSAKDILAFCGSHSGRDCDKIKELGLTLVKGEEISVPAIKELPLTLECRIIYKQNQDLSAMPEKLRNAFYSEGHGTAGDYHTIYYGEIVKAYTL